MLKYKGYQIPQNKKDLKSLVIPGTQLPGVIVQNINNPTQRIIIPYSAEEILGSNFDFSKVVEECKSTIDEYLKYSGDKYDE